MDRDAAIIYVIDNDASVVRFIESVLCAEGYQVEGFLSGDEFLSQPDCAEVGCVIADILLPGSQGTEIQDRLLLRRSHLALIAISGAMDVATAVRVMKHGAVTILQKPVTSDQLLSAVVDGLVQSRSQVAMQHRRDEFQRRLVLLTEDEAEILKCLVKGHSSKEISMVLNISQRTLDRRRKCLLEKMQLTTVTELVAFIAAAQTDAEPFPVSSFLAEFRQ